MNVLEKDQKQGTNQSKNPSATNSPVDLAKMAKPIGTFGGPADLKLRFHDGKLVAADTGDQGGGQN
jgi:hypothetical protein